jgi:hypothetical protein
MSIIVSFLFTYRLSLRGLLYKLYLLNLCFGLLYIYELSSQNIREIETIIYKHSWDNIVSIIEKNEKLSSIMDYMSMSENALMRTSDLMSKIEENYRDIFVYRNVDMTKLIPNDLGANRWEQTIKEIEYVQENTHNNMIYGELSLIIKDSIKMLNNVINPWLILSKNNSSTNNWFIRIPIKYSILKNNEYINVVEYIDISIISFTLVFGYIYYIILDNWYKKSVNYLEI